MKALSEGCSVRAVNGPNRHRGFTLVELMVSLLIGLVIVLGATQLFLTSLQSFEQVKDFGIREGTLNFSVDVLSRDIRRANCDAQSPEKGFVCSANNYIDWDRGKAELSLAFSGFSGYEICDSEGIIEKIYSLSETPNSNQNNDWSLSVEVKCQGHSQGKQPLVSGFVEGGFNANNLDSGLWELTLRLAPIGDDTDPEEITFRVMNRMRALSASDGADE